MLRTSVSKPLFTFLLFSFLLIQIGVGTAQAQTFYLKNYFLGNSYDPKNRSFTWKASKYCPYNYSIKVNRVDYTGGELELHASPGTKPSCKRVYQIKWAFNKDIRSVTCGEKVYIDVTNIPISKQDCGIFVWEGDMNPSSITILTEGESGLVHHIRNKDPQASYRGYVFQHYPGQVVQGEPSAYQAATNTQHLHRARLELVVCSRPDFAKIANGGSFTFRIGNRGISFDVVYQYVKHRTVAPPPPEEPPGCRTFSNPMAQGHRLDWCLNWGQQCGEPAASAWCRMQGLERASEWQIAKDVPPTYVLGDRVVCNQPYCGGFSRITCCGNASTVGGALGRVWHENESGWNGIWTRRGNSNVFDARWGSGSQAITAEMTINISGNRVTISRRNSSDGNDCNYSGTIAGDGVTVEGTYSCTNHPGPIPWRAVIQR